jgi:hypothetical protein
MCVHGRLGSSAGDRVGLDGVVQAGSMRNSGMVAPCRAGMAATGVLSWAVLLYIYIYIYIHTYAYIHIHYV